MLLLSAHEASYFQLPFVLPFKKQLRCYAQLRHMRFKADGGPWPLQHVTLGRTSSYFWVGRWATGAKRLQEARLFHGIRCSFCLLYESRGASKAMFL